jgi:nucleotide sugar dehydrogenase
MSLIVANALTEEYAVIGIDLPNPGSYWKIASLNEGTFPVSSSDKKIDEFYRNARLKNNLYATYDTYAYAVSNVVIVDINLDVKKVSDDDKQLQGYDVNLSLFKKAIESIALNCRSDILVLVETTVPPGTCEKIIKLLFERIFNERGLEHNYKIGHSYERVMPGSGYIDSIQNFSRVYSGVNGESAEATRLFLQTIISTAEYPLTRLKSTNASEMAKVLENSYRAMNIAFVEEWGEFAEEAGVDLYEVIHAIRLRSTHSNLMFPGIGVGGYCLPKDPLLASWSRMNLFNGERNLPQTETAVRINDRMPYHTFRVIQKNCPELSGRSVLLLGLSYLSNVGDTRHTPVEYLHDLLKREGAEITITDPYISMWEEKQMPISGDLRKTLSKTYDITVCCARHGDYLHAAEWKQYLSRLVNSFVLDVCLLLSEADIAMLKQNNNRVKVLGRGDI